MLEFKINPEFTLTDEQSLRGLLEATHPLAVQKFQTILDRPGNNRLDTLVNIVAKCGAAVYRSGV